MIFRDLFELKAYVSRFIELGLEHCQPMLDRRGLEPGKGEVGLCLPPDGERVSEDGTKVYLSCRRVENHD